MMNNELDKEYQRSIDQLISSRLIATTLLDHLTEGTIDFKEALIAKQAFEVVINQLKVFRSLTEKS